MDILDSCQAVLECSRSIPDHQFDEATFKALIEANKDAARVFEQMKGKLVAQGISLMSSHVVGQVLERAARLQNDIIAEIEFTRARVEFYKRPVRYDADTLANVAYVSHAGKDMVWFLSEEDARRYAELGKGNGIIRRVNADNSISICANVQYVDDWWRLYLK